MPVADSSQMVRSRSSRFSERGGSARTCWRRTAPPRPSRTSSSTRTRDTRESATSRQARTAATSTNRTAKISGRTLPANTSGARPAPLVPRRQQLALQAEHLGVLLGVAVVVAEQVQHTVRAEQLELVGRAVARLAGL